MFIKYSFLFSLSCLNNVKIPVRIDSFLWSLCKLMQVKIYQLVSNVLKMQKKKRGSGLKNRIVMMINFLGQYACYHQYEYFTVWRSVSRCEGRTCTLYRADVTRSTTCWWSCSSWSMRAKSRLRVEWRLSSRASRTPGRTKRTRYTAAKLHVWNELCQFHL